MAELISLVVQGTLCVLGLTTRGLLGTVGLRQTNLYLCRAAPQLATPTCGVRSSPLKGCSTQTSAVKERVRGSTDGIERGGGKRKLD